MEINEVISILNRAKTDNERLASVLLVFFVFVFFFVKYNDIIFFFRF